MTHEIKCWPQYFQRCKDGSKTFELRKNDRGYQPGDIVIMREWNPEPINAGGKEAQGFTDEKPLEFKIGYVLMLDSDRVIFSLLPIKSKRG